MNRDIRDELPADEQAVYTVEQAAFGGTKEPELVAALHRRGAVIVSLVALVDNQIVGHVLFSPVTIEAMPDYKAAVTLAPLAVLPAYQTLMVK